MDMIQEACNILKTVLQARAPYRTGNLALNAIRVVENRVIVGGEIAEYAPSTNEPWSSSKWKGAKNPNEGWVQKAIKEASPIIQRVLSGKASDEDVKKAMKYYKGVQSERKKEYIAAKKAKKETIKEVKKQ